MMRASPIGCLLHAPYPAWHGIFWFLGSHTSRPAHLLSFLLAHLCAQFRGRGPWGPGSCHPGRREQPLVTASSRAEPGVGRWGQARPQAGMSLSTVRARSLQPGKSSSTGNLLDKDDLALPPPDYGPSSRGFPTQTASTFKQRPYSMAVPAFSQVSARAGAGLGGVRAGGEGQGWGAAWAAAPVGSSAEGLALDHRPGVGVGPWACPDAASGQGGRQGGPVSQALPEREGLPVVSTCRRGSGCSWAGRAGAFGEAAGLVAVGGCGSGLGPGLLEAGPSLSSLWALGPPTPHWSRAGILGRLTGPQPHLLSCSCHGIRAHGVISDGVVCAVSWLLGGGLLRPLHPQL